MKKDAICSKCNARNLDVYATTTSTKQKWDKLCKECLKETCFKDEYVTIHYYAWDEKYNYYTPIFEDNGPCQTDCKHSSKNNKQEREREREREWFKSFFVVEPRLFAMDNLRSSNDNYRRNCLFTYQKT